jgi:hypothetical protein
MRKHDNDWEISYGEITDPRRKVIINTTKYNVDDKTACLAHAILLLVDAINDKGNDA